MKKRIVKALSVTLTVIVMFFGCVGMSGSIRFGIGTAGSSKGKTAQLPSSRIGSFTNNSTVRLKAARYLGDVEIRANKVVLRGVGQKATTISGDIRVYGNSCTLSNFSVMGDVYLYGNNNTIRNVSVRKSVISKGNNNSW